MSGADPVAMILGIVFAAIGLALVLWPRPLAALQARLLEWQLSLMRGPAGALLIRALGALFLLAGAGLFFLLAAAPR